MDLVNGCGIGRVDDDGRLMVNGEGRGGITADGDATLGGPEGWEDAEGVKGCEKERLVMICF